MASSSSQGKYVTLVSCDDFEFVVLREACMISPAIKGMLSNPFSEGKTGRCVFSDLTGMVLEKIVEYFQYWYKHRSSEGVPDMEIPVELCLELLVAADYLGMDRKVTLRKEEEEHRILRNESLRKHKYHEENQDNDDDGGSQLQ
ncbi:BTB/POZ protein [Xylariaceae sp. FL1019]|nr:BTB/POZ protein [Xylariaceae sp. FL1019]